MMLLIKYGPQHKFEAILPAESLGIVAGRLVCSFSKTETSFSFGTVLDNVEVVAYIAS